MKRTDNPSISHSGHNRGNRAKNGPTPKRSVQRAERYRRFTQTDMIMTGAGWQQVTSRRSLNWPAIKAAIDALDFSNRADRGELCWLADPRRTATELSAHCDVFAARYPDDPRWDSWRRYRRTRNAALS